MSFFTELRRRNVFKVGVAYALVAWVLIQIIVSIESPLHLPDWTDTLIITLLIIGFPVALIITWAFELTPEGIKPTGSSGTPESISRDPERKEVLPNSVAILPFENLSPDPDNAYFAAGIHEEVLNSLAKIKALNVIARTSVLRYEKTDKSIEEIAAELNVETIMEGSVRYANNRVRITAQLINSQTGAHLWSEAYERDLDNVFAIQADIAENITLALKSEFSLAEQASISIRPTTSREAYALYLQAIAISTINNNDPKINELLGQALKLDPDFAIANALMAWRYGQMLHNTALGDAVSAAERNELEQRVHEYSEKAIKADPAVPYAHTAQADIHFSNWRWTEAQLAYEHALEVAPNDERANQYLGFLYAYTGQHQKAIRQSERFALLNPGNEFVYFSVATSYAYAGDYKRAADALQRGLDATPSPFFRTWLAFIEIARGNNDIALTQLRLTEKMLGENPVIVFLPEIAYAYGRLQLHEDALRLFDKITPLAAEHEIGLGGWIMTYAAIGDYEQVKVLLNQAAEKVAKNVIDEGFFNLMNFKMNIMNDPVIEQPEFVALRKRIIGK